MTGMGEVLNPTDIVDPARPRRRPHGREHPARQRKSDRRQDSGHQAALGREEGGGPAAQGRAARHQVRARREPEAARLRRRKAGCSGIRRRVRASSSSFATPSRARKVYQKAWQEHTKAKARQPGRAPAAPRPAARRARRDPRGQAPRARALLPRGRNPHDDPPRGGDGLQGGDLPARARGLQGRQGNRRARRRRLDLLRLVGLQDRSGGRDSRQRRDHDAQGRERVDQLGQRRARAPVEHRSGQVRALGAT